MNSLIISMMLLFYLLSTVTGSFDLIEDKFTQCSRRVNNFDNCITELLEDVRPLLAKGIPELKIPIMEPMDFQNLNFSQKDDAISLHARLRDVSATGLSNFTIKSAKFLADDMEINIRMYIPVLRVSANYIMTGNIILLPVTGDGPMRSILDEINAHLIGKVVVKNEGGKERLGISNTNIDFQLRNVKSRLSNLFNGDPILGETVNHFINENDQLILEQIKPAVSRELSQLTQIIMNSAISTLPVTIVKPEYQSLQEEFKI